MAEQRVLVIGGGISGLTSAVEMAEAGYEVVLVERNPYLGGRVAQLNKYFPKLCPPVCGLELNFRRIKENPRMTVYTMAEVSGVSGSEGNFDVTIKVSPRMVNDKCTACDACAKACPAERSNPFNFGMDKTKAAYLPFEQAYPFKYVIDSAACKGDCGKKCKEACIYDAIDLDMKAETVNVKVGAVINATGWNPYDAKKLDLLGAGQIKNVITNMQMERLAAMNGPTKGQIVRPSDGKPAKKVAFVQCAGSRDENHLAYCSYICCMASLKQTTYLRELYPDSTAKILYIDLRTPGRYENFLNKVKADPKVSLVKGKVAAIEEADGGNVTLTYEDVMSGKKIKETFDMVVLATGMQPTGSEMKVPSVNYSEEGFAPQADQAAGIISVGTVKSPLDVQRSVQDATGATIKGIQSVRR